MDRGRSAPRREAGAHQVAHELQVGRRTVRQQPVEHPHDPRRSGIAVVAGGGAAWHAHDAARRREGRRLRDTLLRALPHGHDVAHPHLAHVATESGRALRQGRRLDHAAS